MEKPTFKVSEPYMDYNDMVAWVYHVHKCEGFAPKWKFWHFMLKEAFHEDVSNPCFRELNLGEIFDEFCEGCDDPAECWEAQILSRMIIEFGRDEIRVQIAW